MAAAASLGAQTPPWATGFRFGHDYTIERLTASRTVDDGFDRGPITLVANVYRPVKNDRHQVVLFSHGSTGGGVTSPLEINPPPPAVMQFFVSRGFTVVAPMRRGAGYSTGTYREECGVAGGQCTTAQNTAVSIAGLQEAILDTDAVIDQIVFGKLVAKGSRIVLAGVSRGGFLSLVIAGRRPDITSGVVNFVGGWFGISDAFEAAENEARMTFQGAQLAAAAPRIKAATLWIYAARDAMYDESVTRRLFKIFTDAGGTGEYVWIGDHTLPNGHNVASQLPLWSARVEPFLAALK